MPSTGVRAGRSHEGNRTFLITQYTKRPSLQSLSCQNSEPEFAQEDHCHRIEIVPRLISFDPPLLITPSLKLHFCHPLLSQYSLNICVSRSKSGTLGVQLSSRSKCIHKPKFSSPVVGDLYEDFISFINNFHPGGIPNRFAVAIKFYCCTPSSRACFSIVD